MTVAALSPVVQDYLKTIWSLEDTTGEPVTSRVLGQRLDVTPSTVSEMVRRLADQGLVTHHRYGAISLTAAGRSLAVAMVRRHRLLETFLAEMLGYAWDEVHTEAETLEHAVSDVFVERLDHLLGHPRRDPHGDPIPDADGVVPEGSGTPLSELPAGTRAVVVRISDARPDLLRHLSTLGIGLDATVELVDRSEAAGTLTVRAGGADPATLALAAASGVTVVPER